MSRAIIIGTQLLVTAVLISILLVSCRDQPTQQNGHTHQEIITQDIPQAFLKFYMNFLSDTTFQKEHILFPLKQKADGTKWTREEWV